MKHLVNGCDWEPGEGGPVEIARLHDRLCVRTADGSHTALVAVVGGSTLVSYRGRTYTVQKASRRQSHAEAGASGEARAPMPGQIVEISVQVGAIVEAGQRLMVLEAMKMQQPVVAPATGRVKSVGVAEGDQVTEGQLLALVEAE